MDDFYDGEELRFWRLDDVIGEAEATGLAERLLSGDPELMLMSAEESANFAVVEHDAEWWKAMLEEMRSIEANKTWDLVNPPTGYRPIRLKWAFKVKRDERGAVV